MRHLTADEFVDVADGTVAETALPHLRECDVCRRQLAELRMTLATAADVGVPEPSPLFWDHFSKRVEAAVASEALSRQPWWRRVWAGPAIIMPAAAVAVALFAIAVYVRAPAHVIAPDRGPAAGTAVPSSVDLSSEFTDVDDPSLTLVAELTAALGWEAAADAGLAPEGSTERAVAHLTRDELRELERLLKEELGRTGA